MLIIISGIFALVIGKVRDDIEDRVYERNMDAAVMLVEAMDLFFAELKNNMEIITYTSEIQDYVFENTDDYLKRIVEKNPSISQMYLIDKEGMQFYKTSHLETLGSRRDREYFQKAIKGEVFVSDVVISRSTGKPITVIAVPIYQHGEIVGVLGASIDLSLITDYIAVYNFEQVGYAYIVDKNGKVISHPNSRYVEEMMDLSYLEAVKSVMLGNDGIGRYVFNEEEKLVAYVNLKENGWGVLVQIPVKDAFRSIDQIQNWLVSLLGLAILSIVIASVTLSSYFMKPIKEIVSIIEGVQENRRGFVVPKQRKDEFGLIQRAFAELMEDLNALYSSLEDQVQMRTNQLTQTNNDLLESNVRLRSAIDELKETQEKLIESEKLSALARIGVRISHELNTPLGICITTSTFLSKKSKDFRLSVQNRAIEKERIEGFLDVVVDSMNVLERQLHKSEQIVGYLKELPLEYQILEKGEVYVYEELMNAKETYQDTSNCMNYEIRILCSDEIRFWGWKGALKEVIEKLLDNSFKHGCLIDGVFIIDIEVEESDDQVKLVYMDNGPGISEEDLRYVFEPLYKESMGAKGAGMGLTKVYQIVKGILGGEIAFEDSVDGGIKLFIKIPKHGE